MDEAIPQVDGLRLVKRADAGEWVGRGEVWHARITGGLAGAAGNRLPADLPGIGECRIRLLRLPVDEALRARALTVANDLLALDDPGLVPIRSVRKGYEGIALVYGHLPSPSTGLHLLARERLLSAGEVVTLGVALCWALAHAHAAGITHGRLSDADVLIGPDGRPVLTGVGVMGVLGAPCEAESDVRALERMLASLLDRASAGAAGVMEALSAASPGAAELAALLAASAAAEPLRTAGSAGEVDIPEQLARGRRHRLPALRLVRRHVRPRVLAAGAGVVLLGALAGWASVPGPHPKAAPVLRSERSAPAGSAGTDWTQVLTRLDRARSAVFERADPGGLIAVDVPASQAYRYDAAAAAALQAHGAHAVGLRIVLESVRVEALTSRRVTLRVTDRRPGYELRDSHDTLMRRVAGRGRATHVIDLEASGTAASAVSAASGAWRFVAIRDPAVTS